ncbi:MAG: hypothetical protein GX919_01405 [Acholeplasmataceae bacterium]|nr:hypothetical protein [Acholeplasmataceae bacterium]
MNNYSKLIKANLISFNTALLTNYKKLGLDEIDAIIILHLYHQKRDRDDFLSIRSLRLKMTIDQKRLSERIYKLVERGFIEFFIEDGQKEQFSLNPTIEKLGLCFEENPVVDEQKERKELVQRIVEYTETSYQKTLSPTDLEIINGWVDEGYTYEQMTEAIFDSLKAKKMHLRYADAILISRNQKRNQVAVDPSIKEMLDQVYVKRR